MAGDLSERQRNRIDELFAEAVNRNPAEREKFITDETSGDPELRSHVLQLLAHAEGSGDRIAAIIQNLAESIPAPRDWTGRRFGPYRILREVGRGGMGIVFEAERDDREYTKRVALKIASSLGDSEALQESFRHERQILAELEHPNIARFLDGGTWDGLPYFAMEFVEGVPITAFCRDRQLGIRQRIELFREVCAAVESAHAQLVIHRDLKPSNILVTSEGVPKLLDFGIAKLLDRTSAGSSETTRSLPLTPDYACPEQVRGERVSTRSDVYSLGLILYELLCGERGQIADTSSPLALDRSICDVEPPPPSAIAARRGDEQLSARLRGDLDTIAAMAIRKEPERRYESVAALSEDLRRYLVGEPVLARPGTFAYKASKFVRRHAMGVIASVLVAASLAGGAGVAIVQARRAERRFDQVRKLANTFLFDFHDRIEKLPGSTEARAFVLTTAMGYLDSLAGEAANDSSLQLELAAAYQRIAMVQGDRSNANLGQAKQAVSNLLKSVKLTEQVIGREPGNRVALASLARGYSRLGDNQCWEEGQPSAAFASFSKGKPHAEQLISTGSTGADDYSVYLDFHQRFANCLFQSEPRQALQLLEKAVPVSVEAARKFNQPRFTNQLANLYFFQARIYQALGDPAKSVDSLKLSLGIAEQLLQADPANLGAQNQIAARLFSLGRSYYDPTEFHLNQPQEAVRFYHRAREIQERLAAADPRNNQAAANLIGVQRALARALPSFDPPGAIRYGNQALAAIEIVHRSNPKSVVNGIQLESSLRGLALAYIAGGDPRQGLQLLSRALAVGSDLYTYAPEDLGVLEGRIVNHLELGRVDMMLKRWPEAEANLAKADEYVAPLRKKLPEDLYFLRDEADIAEAKGDLAAAHGDVETASSRYREAGRMWEKWATLAVAGPYTKFNLDRLHAKAGLHSK